MVSTSDIPKLTSGMATLMAKNKEIEVEEEDGFQMQSSKVIKLRFTRKQYQTFRDACTIFELVSNEPGFTDFVKKALDADIKVATITRQLVTPIVEAPTRIPMKIPRAKQEPGVVAKESYFTAQIEATKKSLQLYEAVKDEVELRHDIKSGVTCVTDVRVMVSKYFSSNNLKNEHGTVLDNFIYKLTPGAINNSKDILRRVDGSYVIPKGDRKVITGIINEVAFGTF